VPLTDSASTKQRFAYGAGKNGIEKKYDHAGAAASISCAACPTQSVDLVFADASLSNLGSLAVADSRTSQSCDGCNDDWDKFDASTPMTCFNMNGCRMPRRVLKDDGAIWVIGFLPAIFPRVGNRAARPGLLDPERRSSGSSRIAIAELQGYRFAERRMKRLILGRQVRSLASHVQL